MMLKLASGRRQTANSIMYSDGSTLFRRDLGTLVEERIRSFPGEIIGIWLNSCGAVYIATSQPPDHMAQLWRQRDTEWDIQPSYIDVATFRSLHYQALRDGRDRIIVKDDALWLIDPKRVIEWARRLIKDEALAARVCHYL